MSDQNERQIVISYYPRQGGLERLNAELTGAGADGYNSLEDALRVEALAVWESTGLIDVVKPAERERAAMLAAHGEVVRWLHKIDHHDQHGPEGVDHCANPRCLQLTLWERAS